jgi:hypothetical protein
MQSPKTAVALVALVLLALATPSAQAHPWRRLGSVGFTGVATPEPGAPDWATATGVHFGAAIVDEEGGDGVFSSLGFMDPVAHQDFRFLPRLTPKPVDPLWTVGGFSFVLERVVVRARSATALVLDGYGYVTGIDSPACPGGVCPARWDFTASLADGRAAFHSTTSFPEPATFALLGLGLAGAAGLARRRRRR